MIPLLYLVVLAGLAGFFLFPTFVFRRYLPAVSLSALLLILLIRLVSGGRENLNYLADFEYAVGYKMGTAAAEADPGVLVLMVPSPGRDGEDHSREDLITGFMDGLGEHPVSLHVMEDPRLPSTSSMVGIDPGVFRKALSTFPDAGGVVSLVGLPSSQPQTWPGLPLWAREEQMSQRVGTWLASSYPLEVVTLREDYDRLARPKGRDPLKDFDLRYTLHSNSANP